MVWVSLAPKSPDLISIGPLGGAGVTVVHGSGGGVVHGGGVGQLVSDGVVDVVVEEGHGGQSVGVAVEVAVVVVVEVVVVVVVVVGVGGTLRLTRDLPKMPPCFTWMRKLISSFWSSCRHLMPPRSWSSALFSSFAALLIPMQFPNCISVDLMPYSGLADEGNARFTVNG